MRRGRWYNAKEQMFYFEKMIKLPIGEDGRIVRDENRTGQEIRKGDTLEKEWHRKKIIELLETATERELTLTYQFLKSRRTVRGVQTGA